MGKFWWCSWGKRQWVIRSYNFNETPDKLINKSNVSIDSQLEISKSSFYDLDVLNYEDWFETNIVSFFYKIVNKDHE